MVDVNDRDQVGKCIKGTLPIPFAASDSLVGLPAGNNQRPCFQCMFRRKRQGLQGCCRLDDIILCTGLYGIHGNLFVALGRHQYNRMAILSCEQQPGSVSVRQFIIAYNQVRILFINDGQRIVHGTGNNHSEPVSIVLECSLNCTHMRNIVFNDQYQRCAGVSCLHCSSFCSISLSSCKVSPDFQNLGGFGAATPQNCSS